MLVILGCVNSVLFGIQLDSLSNQAKKDSLIELGIRMYSEGRYAESIKSFLSVGNDTSKPALRFYLGMSYSGLNDFQKARKYLQQAVKIDSMNVSYRFQLGRLLSQYGMIQDGLREYETIIQIDSTYTSAFFHLGLIYNELRAYDRSRLLFEKVIKMNPRDFLSYYYLGTAFVALGNQDSARIFLTVCLTLNPSFVQAISVLASLHYLKKEFDEAFRLYSTAFKNHPQNADFAFRAGLCNKQLGNYSKAIVYFRGAIEVDPSNALYFAQLGYAYYHEKRFDSSTIAYQKALSLDRENPSYYINQALAFQSMDSTDRAINSFKGAIVAFRPKEIANVYLQIGGIYFQEKDYHNALSAFQKSFNYDPLNRELYFWLGSTYDRLARVQLAIIHYKKFLEVTLNDRTEHDRRDLIKTRLQLLGKKQ